MPVNARFYKKEIMTTLALFCFSHTMSMIKTEFVDTAHRARLQVGDIKDVISTGDETKVRDLLKQDDRWLFLSPYSYHAILSAIGVPHAAEIGNTQMTTFILSMGLSVGAKNPLIRTQNQEVIEAILTNCVVRPCDYELKSAHKKIVTFLCCVKRMEVNLPPDLRILILGHTALIGDLIIGKLYNRKLIPERFLIHAENRLLACTIPFLENLRAAALKKNPNQKIPEIRDLQEKILKTIDRRIHARRFLCNEAEPEPKEESGWCSIL